MSFTLRPRSSLNEGRSYPFFQNRQRKLPYLKRKEGWKHILKRKDGGYSLSRPTLIRFLRSSDMSTWQVAWQVTWQVVWQVAWHIEDGVRGRGSQNNPKDIFVICSEDHNISNKISKCRSQATTSFLRRSMTTSS